MKNQAKNKTEELRKENAIKNMYYTRYFLVRYVVALYFFLNLYWVLMFVIGGMNVAVILPSSMLVLGFLSIWEQSRMFSREQVLPKLTKFYFYLSSGLNLVVLILLALGQWTALYPFLKASDSSISVLALIHLLGLGLSSWMLMKLKRIQEQKDKQYYRIKQYFSAIKHSKQ